MLVEYDAIYLSPHLDDAALSCGGQIFARTSVGQSVLIVTVMAGDPPPMPVSGFARGLHQRWNLLADTVSIRRREDIEACHVLGADYVHWEIADCIYRYHPDKGKTLYNSVEDLFGSVHATESKLIDELAQRIAQLPESAQIYAPLTVGHHVDHQITRAAAEASLRGEIFYYEDYPYVRESGSLEATLADTKEWRSKIIPLRDRDLQAKVEAIAAFASQLTSFFLDRVDMAKQIQSHANRTGGERIWRRLSLHSAN